MLTPAFELRQDDNFLKICIKAPYAKVSETEIFVEDNDFKFFSKPYFLRLTLPGNIVEDGQEKAEYNADKGEFHLCFAKQNPGETFEGLDMITKLLAPKGSKTATQPLIEVIDNSQSEESQIDATGTNTGECEVAEEEKFDWCVEQTPYTEDCAPSFTSCKYGFANQKTGVFQRLQEELRDIIDCPDPDNMEPVQRQEARLAAENDKFDPEHYLGDYFEDDMIQPLLDYRPPWYHIGDGSGNSLCSDIQADLTDEEKDVMRKLPNKEYLLDDKEETIVYLGLVDIIFAYAYNTRFTEGESNVEAGWNISKLSATLSWFEVYSSLHEVIVTSYRRCLCYPLYRNWKLCHKVLQDVKQIFKLGRQAVLKCLLDVRQLLLDTDSRYILNDLYVTDYCVWIQHIKSSKLQSLSDTLQKIDIKKDDVGFNLVDLEQLAVNAVDDTELDTVTEGISGLNVDNNRDSDDDSSESDGETSSDDSGDTSDSEYTTDTDDEFVNDGEPRNSNDNRENEKSKSDNVENIDEIINKDKEKRGRVLIKCIDSKNDSIDEVNKSETAVKTCETLNADTMIEPAVNVDRKHNKVEDTNTDIIHNVQKTSKLLDKS